MTTPVTIIDGESQEPVHVTKDGELLTIASLEPPLLKQKIKPFRQYFTSDGLVSGSNDLGVDGSSLNVDFWIPADQVDDRYITTLSFVIGYGSVGKPYLFANIAALTNGLRLFYATDQGEIDLHDAIKANIDLFRLSSEWIPVGWELRHALANNDYGYLVTFDLAKVMPPYGVKLDRATSQKLSLTVRDDLSASGFEFNCIAYGFDRFE